MIAAFKAGKEGSTRWLWTWLVVFVVVASLVTQLVFMGAQLRAITLGRVALGWPLTDAYYVTDIHGSSGGYTTVFTTQSHFELVPSALAVNVMLGVAVFLVVILLLRLAWVAMRPKPKPLVGDSEP
jgi:hypothetical protein